MRKMMAIPHHKFPWCENKGQSLPTDKHNFSTERMISRSRPIVPIVIFLQCHFPDQSRNICQRHMVPVTERSVLRKFSLCTSCSSAGFALLLPPKKKLSSITKNIPQSPKYFEHHRIQPSKQSNFITYTEVIATSTIIMQVAENIPQISSAANCDHQFQLWNLYHSSCKVVSHARSNLRLRNCNWMPMSDFKSCSSADAWFQIMSKCSCNSEVLPRR